MNEASQNARDAQEFRLSSPLEIFAFPDTFGLAESTAKKLGLSAHPIEVHTFPDGESLVRAPCRAVERALIFRSLDHPNEKLVELLLASDALRRQGVGEVGLVAPYLGYMRQDRIFSNGEPISQRVIARMLDTAFDELITIEAHLHRIARLSEIFACRAESVSASHPIASWLRTRTPADVLIGPDSESEPWIRSIADEAGLPWRVGAKTRHADRDVEIRLPDLPGACRSAWIVDDIASSGATLGAIVQILAERGIEEVGAIVVHALFEADTLARLFELGATTIVSTDSIVHPTNDISLASLLAQKISSNHRRSEGS